MTSDMNTRVFEVLIVVEMVTPWEAGKGKKSSLFNEMIAADSWLYNADTAGITVEADGAGNEVLTVSLDLKITDTRYGNHGDANESLCKGAYSIKSS